MPDDICGSRSEHFKMTCDLPPGHVKTPGDWHHGTASGTQELTTQHYRFRQVNEETLSWAPHSFEIPRQPKTEDRGGIEAAQDPADAPG